MSYLQNDLNIKERGRRNKRFWQISVIVSAIIVLIIIITPLKIWFSGAFFSVAKVLWQGKLAITSSDSQTMSLQNELAKTDSLRLENKQIREENLQLRLLLDSVPDTKKPILSTILSRPSLLPFDTFMISGGSDLGFAIGDYVYGTDSVVLGKISEVYFTMSKVVLFSSFEVETPVLVGSNYISLIAIGRGGQNFSIGLPEGLDVKVGDALVLPLENQAILAEIGDVKVNSDGTSKTIIARSPINMYQLRFVLVVKINE